MPEQWALGVAGFIGLAVIWYVGHQLLRRKVHWERRCPRCGRAQWHRRHRTLADHIFGLGLNVRRYRCANLECQWEGLRRRSQQ